MGGGLIGAPDDIGFDLRWGEGEGINVGFDVLDLIDPGDDLGLIAGCEEFFGDGSGGDAADCFSG